MGAAGPLVAVGYMDQRTGGFARAIQLTVSRDYATTFSPPIDLGVCQTHCGDVTLVVAPDGRAIAAWAEDDNPVPTKYRLRTAYASDPSGPWTKASYLDDDTDGVDRPWLALAPDGTVYLAWVQNAASNQLHVARSTDRGVSFQEVYVSSPSSTIPRDLMVGGLSVGPDGTVYAAVNSKESRKILVIRSINQGATFDGAIAAALDTTERIAPACAALPTGGVVTAWGDHTYTGGFNVDGPVRLAFSTDGANFGAPITIPAPSASVTLAYPRPSIAVDSAGVHVLYYARRTVGPSPGDQWVACDVTVKADGTVGPVTELSSSPFRGVQFVDKEADDWSRWPGDMQSTVVSNGTVLHAFSQAVGSDSDIYVAQIVSP